MELNLGRVSTTTRSERDVKEGGVNGSMYKNNQQLK